MKNLTKLFLCFFFACPFFAFSQDEIAGNIDYKNFSNSANLEFMELPTSPDILLSSSYAKMAPKDKCKTYKKLKTTGLILTIAGSVVLAGGIALIVSAVNDDDIIYIGEDDNNDLGKFILGYGCVVIGGASTAAGIPLMIIGSIKSKKYCNGEGKSSMSIGAQRNGVGASFTF